MADNRNYGAYSQLLLMEYLAKTDRDTYAKGRKEFLEELLQDGQIFCHSFFSALNQAAVDNINRENKLW